MKKLILIFVFLISLSVLGFSQKQSKTFFLKKGWSMISCNIIPDSTSLDYIFDSKLHVLVSMDGVYWPEQNVNTIGEWGLQ